MELTAFATHTADGWKILPADLNRSWMDATPNRFAYRCLPLLIANQAGWVVTSPVGFSVRWNGRADAKKSLKFKFDESPDIFENSISSHFGSGILTFTIPYLFRSQTGICLSVRGLPNAAKFNCSPLEGIVETNWSPYTFTMNYKLQLPLFPVRFEKEEPICFIQPISLELLECIEPSRQQLAENEAVNSTHNEWANNRRKFNEQNFEGRDWQKHYFKGTLPSGESAKGHRTKIAIRPFVDGNCSTSGQL